MRANFGERGGNVGAPSALRHTRMSCPAARWVRHVLSMCCLALLSGCLTCRLWEEEGTQTLVRDERRAELAMEGVVRGDGRLEVVAERLDAADLPAASGAALPRSRWTLVPREEGELAAGLLRGAVPFTVEDRRLEVHRDANVGEVYRSTAVLHLAVTLHPDALAEPLDGAQLPVACAAALQAAPRNDFSGRGPYRLLPGMLAECVDRLVGADLRPLLPPDPATPGTAELLALAWLDAATLQPIVDAGAVTTLLGPDFSGGELSLMERLNRLQRLRLVAAASVDGAHRTFLLRPDVVWSYGAMAAPAGGPLRHESHWLAEAGGRVPGPEAAEAALAGESVPPMRWRGAMDLRWYDYHYELRDDFALQVLLTPFAMAADLVGLGILAAVFGSCDEDDDDAPWHGNQSGCRR